MKSKLTLRLEKDVKERAKQLADERGISVSKLVEDYFRLLLQEKPPQEGNLTTSSVSEEETDSLLSPRIQKLKEQLGQRPPSVTLDEDTRQWIEKAAQKHA